MPTLNWIGKDAVVEHHKDVPYHLLHCNPDLSVGDAGSGNLLVKGDNLLALKALLPYYAGKVKCVYIDPPYNTGNENWEFNDNVNSQEIRVWLGQVVGKEAEDLSRHDKWLCMMYPRLLILREFLREDGVIIVSIDDNEIEDLKHLLTEIFGKNNVLATLVWQKGKKGDAKFFSIMHEYIVVVAKNKATLKAQKTKWRRRKTGIDKVLDYYAGLREELKHNHETIRDRMMEWYRSLPNSDPARAHKHYNWSDDRGLYFASDFAGPDDGRENRPRYDILHPVTRKPCKKPSTGWRWDEKTTLDALAEEPRRVHFGPDEKTIPCRKSYLFDISGETFPSVFYKDGRAATLELEKVLGESVFSFPKDAEIISDLIDLVCGTNDLIIDSFAGAGVTGEAVLRLNKRDGGKRNFILVELEPDVASNITAKRLKNVIEGYEFSGIERSLLFSKRLNVTTFRNSSKILNDIKEIKKEERDKFSNFETKIEDGQISFYGIKQIDGKSTPLGGGFRFCEIGDTLFDAHGQIRANVTFSELAQHIFFTETGEPLPASSGSSPLLGVVNGVAVYLLYNGVLSDKRKNGGNILTRAIFANLPPHDGPKVIYGHGSLLSRATLQQQQIRFRQIPYEVKVS